MKFLFLAFVSLLFITYSNSQPRGISVKIEKSALYKYLLYTPDGYKDDRSKKWPLIIYLHGRSACGNNFDKVRRYGIPFFLDRGMKIDAIVAAPQCPFGKNWVTDNWFGKFLDDIKEKYRIDENRVYLTGMSLGGFGTFSLAINYPDIFAAVAPLCGGGQPSNACSMKDIPTWVFHGNKDDIVPVKRSEEMVEAIKKCGGNPKFSIMEGQSHDIHKTYNNTDLYTWMLGQSKSSRLAGKNYDSMNDKKVLLPSGGEKNQHNGISRKKNKKNKSEKKEESDKIKVVFE